MINPFLEVDWNPDLARRRRFARSLVLGFPVVAAFVLLQVRMVSGYWRPGPALAIGVIGTTLGVVWFFLPRLALPFYIAWYAVACAIGFIVGNVMLTAIYYLVVTPIGLIRRASHRTPIQRHTDAGSESYWIDAPESTDPDTYFNQY